MAALSHAVGTRVRVTNGSYRNKTGTVGVQDGHKVIYIDNNSGQKPVLYGASDSMVERL
ncbi:hypothetical protein SEA_PARADIDDLES_106 [Streptomyces phage Paradiddles]|uniref:KOW domain-containing protein n=2 Tax=Samistivirus TaxID=2560220 RepID=A0A222YYN7_9CAUD|nr:hypothetical protein FDI36_gp153 [Streptomyces phage NootNoot]YP_009611096.1 hypothetical protein FDI37_gp149 [Streptomyces phage Paradiddles]UGL63104.1 hypothetical protein SEA_BARTHOLOMUNE_110 [Streptomyces phage Bartholomune]UOW93537.1 hypothetical protein SEA_SQUILLIUM_111 [Streptomyces phage Squillium]WNM73368.1 hypothetical protein SEA_LIANDRY_110 [Streptomyces phage Liandry]WNM74767.1 hypothetical protein SEA_PINKIEPIE_109 [Streptomyces phage PinkiePie]ASR77369.1 hypothetical protei